MDLEKAYDHINWDFLMYMLRRCGFRGKWCSWIAHCISSMQFLALVNGSSTRFFSISRGSRQEDPLSPLVFVLVMKALGMMISIAVSGGLLSGFCMRIEVDISHLVFTDGTLIFCGADPNHLYNLRSLFLLFEAVLGLKANLAKSELVLVGNVDNVARLAWILGCGVSSLPLKYISLPLGVSYKAKHIWDGVIEKIEPWLARWTWLYLFKGGRLPLSRTPYPTYLCTSCSSFLSLLVLLTILRSSNVIS